MSEHPGVVVTLPEIYADVQAVKSEITGVSAKLDRFISVNERLDSHKEDIAGHEGRIRKLEIQIAAQWVIVGLVCTAIGGLLTKSLTGG